MKIANAQIEHKFMIVVPIGALTLAYYYSMVLFCHVETSPDS